LKFVVEIENQLFLIQKKTVERYAIIYGLMKLGFDEDNITNNLGICGDCHDVRLNCFQKMLNRRIITGDSKRFHEFDRGVHVVVIILK